MPKAKSSKKAQSAPGLTVTIPGLSSPLAAPKRFCGPQTCRDPKNNGEFWYASSMAVKRYFTPLFRRWLKEGHPESYLPNYGMEDLDAEIEFTAGNSLILAGPLIDSCLTILGDEVSTKLMDTSRRTKLSKIGMATFELVIPPTAFSPIMWLIQQYGGQVRVYNTHRGTYGQVEIKITSLDVLKSIVSGARSDGRNHLMRRHFESKPTSVKEVLNHYRGQTEVVATDAFPFQLDYHSGSGKLKVSFYKQKYDRNGVAEAPVLQTSQNF